MSARCLLDVCLMIAWSCKWGITLPSHLVEWCGNEPARCEEQAESSAVAVEKVKRFVVVRYVERGRMTAKSTQRAVATSVGRFQPTVDRSTQVYLPPVVNTNSNCHKQWCRRRGGSGRGAIAAFPYPLNLSRRKIVGKCYGTEIPHFDEIVGEERGKIQHSYWALIISFAGNS